MDSVITISLTTAISWSSLVRLTLMRLSLAAAGCLAAGAGVGAGAGAPPAGAGAGAGAGAPAAGASAAAAGCAGVSSALASTLWKELTEPAAWTAGMALSRSWAVWNQTKKPWSAMISEVEGSFSTFSGTLR